MLAALEAAGVPLERSPQDKDESDTELAIRAALRLGHDGVLILGALGGRNDHALANIGLLAMPELAGREAAILDARSRTVLISAPGPDGAAVERLLPGRPGDLVSLLPLGAGRRGRDDARPGLPARGRATPRRAHPRAVERPLGARCGGHCPARPAARRGVAC